MIQDFQVHLTAGTNRGFTAAPWRNVYGMSSDLSWLLVANDEGRLIPIRTTMFRVCAGSICQVEGCSMSRLCVVCRAPDSFLRDPQRRYVCEQHFDPMTATECPLCELPRTAIESRDGCLSARCPMRIKETTPNG